MCTSIHFPVNAMIINKRKSINESTINQSMKSLQCRITLYILCYKSTLLIINFSRCLVVDCGPLPSPKNGDVTYKDSLFGSAALYECRNGFAIQGVSTRKCLQSGKWSDSAPLCNGKAYQTAGAEIEALISNCSIFYLLCMGRTAVQCSQLRTSGNLQVVVSGTMMGATATYTCSSGFQVTGTRVRTCISGGVWSDQEPSCKRK